MQKLQQLRISHRRYACFPQHPYPSIFRLNFHHYYPVTYDSYSCDSSSYLRRSADLKAKRRRGRPAKSNEPVSSKLPFVQGYSFPLAGGNYYAAPYAMPYAPPLSLGYFPPAPPFYLPHHSLGPAPPSPFMRPAVPPPKAFHPSGHSKLQPGAKLRSSSGPVQGPTVRGEGLGSLGGGSVGGLGGVRLHKRKHKHKHKHKDEPLLSLRDRQDLGGLFSGAKTNAHLNTLRDRRELGAQESSKQRSSARSAGLASSLGMFQSEQLSTQSLVGSQFHSRQTRQPINSFMGSYSSRSKQSDSAANLFMGTQEEASDSRTMKTRLSVFGDQGLQSFQAARQDPGQTSKCSTTSLAGRNRLYLNNLRFVACLLMHLWFTVQKPIPVVSLIYPRTTLQKSMNDSSVASDLKVLGACPWPSLWIRNSFIHSFWAIFPNSLILPSEIVNMHLGLDAADTADLRTT